jgi:hypothetical protein
LGFLNAIKTQGGKRTLILQTHKNNTRINQKKPCPEIEQQKPPAPNTANPKPPLTNNKKSHPKNHH